MWARVGRPAVRVRAFEAGSTTLSCVLSLLMVVLAAPRSSPASSAPSLPSRAAIFVVPKELAEASAARVETELRKSLDERSVALTDLESLFPGELPPNKAVVLMKEGVEAVDNLDFDAAGAKFNEALSFLGQNPALADAKELATLHLHLANIALQTGGKPGQKVAAENVSKALVFFPAIELDPKYFGPDVKKVVDKALTDLNKAPKGALRIASTPLGAEVTFRGAVLGTTPLPESPMVPGGRHLVLVKRPGYVPAGLFTTVTKEGAQATVELNEVEGFGQARKSMSTLVPANLGKGLPREARQVAEAMKSRFLIVAQVGEGGEGALEVWDVETNNRLKGVALPSDGNFGPVVDQVKAFLANPAPVAAAKSGGEGRRSAEGGGDSVLTKWWFWTAVGGVVVVGTGAATVGVLASQPSQPRFNPVLFPYN